MLLPARAPRRPKLARPTLAHGAASLVLLLLAACGTVDVGLPVPTDPTGPILIGDAVAYVAEAESIPGSAAFAVGSDDTSSGGGYLVQPATVPASTTGIEVASLAIDVAEEGAYTLWVRVFAPALDADAVYLGFDGATRRVFAPVLDDYVWIEVERRTLDVGPHRISLGHGEPGLWIDLFAVVMDEKVSTVELEGLVSSAARRPKKPASPTEPTTPPAPSPSPTSPLRGNPNFDAAQLTGDVARWYAELLRSIEQPSSDLDPLSMAGKDDLYTYGRTLHAYLQSILVAFRLTGDLRLLDHADVIVERMRTKLRDGWRGTVDGTDGTTDGYLNWVYRYSDEPDLMGKDTHQSNEMRTHAILASIAYALHVNRDLASPAGINYGAHADFWRSYLVDHFEAKWRARRGVATGFPIMTVPHTHTYYAWTKWHYYMGLLTGNAAYTAEARRMADVLWNEVRTVTTPSGTAYVWARSVLSLGGAGAYLHPTTYARYVYGDIVEFHLEGFHRWASASELTRFARTFTEYVMDTRDPKANGFAADIGGGAAKAGLPSDPAWGRMTANRYRVSSYALIGAWDASNRLPAVSAAIYASSSTGGAMMAAGVLLDVWSAANAPAPSTLSAAR
jgi:hypothetical protein